MTPHPQNKQQQLGRAAMTFTCQSVSRDFWAFFLKPQVTNYKNVQPEEGIMFDVPCTNILKAGLDFGLA